jgi:hypothetical protein
MQRGHAKRVSKEIAQGSPQGTSGEQFGHLKGRERVTIERDQAGRSGICGYKFQCKSTLIGINPHRPNGY